MSVDNPSVTVLMADYNTDPSNLRASVESVLSQSFADFEFLVIDDGSEVPTIASLAGVNDSRLKVVRFEQNQGFVSALNTGLRLARGDYIVRMDTDDTVSPMYIETLYDFITREPAYSVVSCRAQEFRDDGSLGVTVGRLGEKRKSEVISRDTPVHAASIMLKKHILGVGGYPDYLRAEDLALWCELLLAGRRLMVIEPVLYYYRVNQSDYHKRSLRHRKGEIAARMRYYPRLNATFWDYRHVLKSIVAGLLPAAWLRRVHEATVRGS